MPALGIFRTLFSFAKQLILKGATSSPTKNIISHAGVSITNFINEKTSETKQQIEDNQSPQFIPLPSLGLLARIAQLFMMPELIIAIVVVGGIVVVMVMSYFTILNAAPFPTNT